jgi:hypothetical protein
MVRRTAETAAAATSSPGASDLSPVLERLDAILAELRAARSGA